MIVLNPVKDTSEISDFWGAFALTLHDGIKAHGLDKFLQWGFIQTCMVHEIKAKVFRGMLKDPRWANLIKPVVNEDSFGSPKRYKLYPESSGNLLHHAYTLMEYRILFSGLKSIYEFGGGYGCMCKLIHRLGFKGVYTIRDLPILSFLQKEYLSKVLDEKITEVKTDHYQPQVDLFIAMWSLSESPFETRDKILKKIKTDNYLIAFQKKFLKYNNLKYFKQMMKSMPGYGWRLYEIKHLPGNYYLFGRKIQ